MRRGLFAVVLVVVLAGCAAPIASTDSSESLDDDIGVVDGIAYDEDIGVTVDDGLNETELDLLAARSMARIEVIRGLAFEERVDIEVWTREEYLEWRENGERSAVSQQFENQVWEAKFVVGQDRDVTETLDETLGGAVQGFYLPSSEQIVIVTDDEDDSVDKHTLVHELVHALQDQQFGLEPPPEKLDPALARDGVVEGEAELVPEKYFDRCESEWSCLRPPTIDGERAAVDPGIIMLLIHPYERGPGFVDAIHDRGGWDAVDDLYNNYPESTAQIIDPELYPDVSPVNVTVEDRSTEEWGPLAHDPTAERIGQAAIHVMFWHNGIITPEEPFSYSHPVSDGWAGDELVPYVTDTNETGYVWETEWDSVEDAEQFLDAYHELLDEQDALERGPRQFVIPDGPYEGAFDVHHEGTTVTIVNGPDIDSLEDIHDFD